MSLVWDTGGFSATLPMRGLGHQRQRKDPDSKQEGGREGGGRRACEGQINSLDRNTPPRGTEGNVPCVLPAKDTTRTGIQ